VPPEYLVDRNIGISVVASLRAAGLTVHSLADVYGNDRSQEVTDPEWISLAGRSGFVALTKDKRIRHRPAESEAVLLAKLHLFALVAGNANLRETAAAFLAAERRMAEIADREGRRGHLGRASGRQGRPAVAG
jgi:predicted nuclease of predicted toxin-antitoxin system